MKSVIIIGSGFAGLSAACFLAKNNWQVTVIEKNKTVGGRARQFTEQGFTFDMGPSWYWMPDVFERFFNQFGKKVSDYYHLNRLNPSYRTYWQDDPMDIPANYEELKQLFETTEKGAGEQLDKFLEEALYKYNVGIHKLVFKPGQSVLEFADLDLVKGIFKLDVFQSMRKHVGKFFKNKKLKQLMEFPVLFLGALPQDIPALYSLMNYADIKLGTWYPNDGMYSIVKATHNLALELGVTFVVDNAVTKINIENKKVRNIETKNGTIFIADVLLAGADYHHVETQLLEPQYQSYSKKYWDSRVMAPSSLLYYVGINKKLKNIVHHSLFFDVPFDKHGNEIYENPQWPTDPLFYVSAVSQTDLKSAPEGHENLFFLIPVAAGLEGDTEDIRKKYFDMIVERMENKIGETFKDNIVYYKSFAVKDFKEDYNSFKGNAYGLANTLMQTSILKPSCKSKKVKNLFYTGQLTVPGPGVPPSFISGELIAKEIEVFFTRN